jgi:hypothetical protein
LVSPSQGLVTLIDGASDELVGSVRVPAARRGDGLSVVQSGSSAYVVNASQGTVARVDGGTYEVSAPVRFGDGRGSLEVFAGSEVLYVVDGVRRKATETDPVTLAVRRELSLAAQPGPGQSVVDGAGRLWVVDGGGGGMTWFDEGGKRERPGVGDGRSRLALVQGGPVLVDTSRGRVGRLRGSGEVASWSCLEVREGDEAQVLGSATSARVAVAVRETGTLVISAVGRDECGTAVEVGRPGDEFGPLVESGGFVFVPNRSSGETVVVELATGQVVARFDLVKPHSRLDLLAKDGLVFYNDLDGNRAGVIRFDGTRWRKGKNLLKYDPAKPGRNLLGPDAARSETSPQKIKPPPGDKSSKATGPGSAPEAPAHDVPATTPPPGAQPSGPPATTSPVSPPAITGPTRPPASRRPSPSPATTRPAVLPGVRIVPSPASPEVGEQVTLRVVADGRPSPASAQWNFGDGQTGSGLTVTHGWDTDGTFQVTVQARFPDGRTKSATKSIDVAEGMVEVPNVLGDSEASARAQITAAGLTPVVVQARHNTVEAGRVADMNPQPGEMLAQGDEVEITVSTGPTPTVNLNPLAGNATWRTGAGIVPYPGQPGDPRGGAAILDPGWLLEDDTPSTSGTCLITHPEWVDNGWIEGDYPLPDEIIAGDHFRAVLGFQQAQSGNVGAVTFIVQAVFADDTVSAPLLSLFDTQADKVMHPVDVDLTPVAGAQTLRLRVEAGASAGQDWAAWVNPRVEG